MLAMSSHPIHGVPFVRIVLQQYQPWLMFIAQHTADNQTTLDARDAHGVIQLTI